MKYSFRIHFVPFREESFYLISIPESRKCEEYFKINGSFIPSVVILKEIINL